MYATLHDTASETLTSDDMKVLEQFAVPQHYEDNDVVYAAGSEEIDLFVVKRGTIEVLNPADNTVVAVHEAGGFSGDIDLLTGRPILVTGRAKGVTEVLCIPNAKLHEVMLRVPSLSEKMLTTFVNRRNTLGKLGKLGLRVVGPARCKATTTIREFLYKNFVPFTYHDIATPDGQRVWAELGSPTDLPIVQCQSGKVLSRPSLRDVADGAGVWRHCPNS